MSVSRATTGRSTVCALPQATHHKLWIKGEAVSGKAASAAGCPEDDDEFGAGEFRGSAGGVRRSCHPSDDAAAAGGFVDTLQLFCEADAPRTRTRSVRAVTQLGDVTKTIYGPSKYCSVYCAIVGDVHPTAIARLTTLHDRQYRTSITARS
jgi:hypothetical protein